MSTNKRSKPVNMNDGASHDGDHFNEPTTFGPGIWFSLHCMSAHATTPEKIDDFIENFKTIISNLRCIKCRDHAMKYATDHPIEQYKNLKDKYDKMIGMQKYIWQFHNNVNSRLEKPQVDWETAYSMYNSPEAAVCASDCGGTSEIQSLIPGEKSITMPSAQKTQRVRTALLYGTPQTLQKVQTGFRMVNGF